MLAECATQLYIARLMLLHIAYKAEHKHGPAAGELDRQGLSGQHGAPRGRHRHPAARRARLLAAIRRWPRWYTGIRSQRLVDGPDEVHRWTVGRNVIKAYQATGTTASMTGGDLL